MGPDPVRSSAPGCGGSLPLPPLALPPVGESHHWSATAVASALHSAPGYHSPLRSGHQHSLGGGNQHSHASGSSNYPSPHSASLNSLNSLNSMEAFSFTAPPLAALSPHQHHQPHPSSVAAAAAMAPHLSLLPDAVPPRKSNGTEISDETPAPPPPTQHQQQQWSSMNHAGNAVPSSPALPASPAAIPSAASPAPRAARLADALGVFANAGCDFPAPDAAFAGRNCDDWPVERAGVTEECREAHSSIVDTKNAADTAAAAANAGGMPYVAGSVLVPDSELLACLNSLTSCLSWPDLTLLDSDAGVGKPSDSPIKVGGVGFSACMMGSFGEDMGGLIDGRGVPREDGEVPALRPDFLLEMMSSG
ncbi:unnamed protein product [Closterium sp. Yama58-4]|nr:unnamed protein product [Closterium sp. Yama58-4]